MAGYAPLRLPWTAGSGPDPDSVAVLFNRVTHLADVILRTAVMPGAHKRSTGSSSSSKDVRRVRAAATVTRNSTRAAEYSDFRASARVSAEEDARPNDAGQVVSQQHDTAPYRPIEIHLVHPKECRMTEMGNAAL